MNTSMRTYELADRRPTLGHECREHGLWRLLDDLRSLGFAQPEVVTYWSRRFATTAIHRCF